MPEIGHATRQIIMSAGQIAEAIERMAQPMKPLARNGSLALVGVQRRGVPLAERLRAVIAPDNPDSVPLGKLDITLYRDDLSTLGPQPILGPTRLPFEIDDRVIVLVDDVLYTGRTVRAALEALLAFGRPRAVRLAVLIDRGHREYPIQADFVGQTVDTTDRQIVEVMLAEIDPKERVVLVTR